MSKAWAEIYGDEITATVTMTSTNFIPLVGSTVLVGMSGGNDYVKAKPRDTTSMRFVMGKDSAGVWRVGFYVSFSASVGNKTYHAALFRNSSRTPISIERKIGTAGDVGAAAAYGFLALKNNDIIDMRGQAESSGAVVTVNHFGVTLDRVTTSTSLGVN